jgi:hypothetical protein
MGQNRTFGATDAEYPIWLNVAIQRGRPQWPGFARFGHSRTCAEGAPRALKVAQKSGLSATGMW